MVKDYGQIDGCALTPDQLTHYVEAISGMKARLINGFPFYMDGETGILVTFTQNPEYISEQTKAVIEAAQIPHLKNITVLGQTIPENAPQNAKTSSDFYWKLDLPAKPSPKTANMIRRAKKETEIIIRQKADAITADHNALIMDFCQRKKDNLDEASIFIFNHLTPYVAGSENVKVFSAYSKNRLAGFVIGDFTSFENVFYMFAFRSHTAPPGTADLLLHSLVAEAENLGFGKINLGLGINAGVEFFKKKWGAEKYFPYMETSWEIPKKPGIFSKFAKSLFKSKK